MKIPPAMYTNRSVLQTPLPHTKTVPGMQRCPGDWAPGASLRSIPPITLPKADEVFLERGLGENGVPDSGLLCQKKVLPQSHT